MPARSVSPAAGSPATSPVLPPFEPGFVPPKPDITRLDGVPRPVATLVPLRNAEAMHQAARPAAAQHVPDSWFLEPALPTLARGNGEWTSVADGPRGASLPKLGVIPVGARDIQF